MKFFKGSILLFLVISNLQVVKAQHSSFQNNCGTQTPGPGWERDFQKLVTQYTSNQTANKTQQQVYTIPVIFHVIHGGQPVGTYPNVPQSQVNWQITTMNNDFAGTGFYAANYPANAFATWAATASVLPASLDQNGRVAIANCNIQFCLATKDTNGNTLPEPGIIRYDYNAMNWANPAAASYSTLNTFVNMFESVIKPQTIWDVSKYLNIWVSDNSPALALSGYATYPYLSTLNDLPVSSIGSSTNDGVYCRAFDVGYLGHVASHEVGHWLGLWHTWGDTLCGNDYCNDTPPAPAPSSGSPVYPFNVNACGNSGNGVMFMNFMDYSNNNARYMFTTDQANRMLTAMANSPYRKYLGTHNLCSVQNASVYASFSSANTTCTGKVLDLSNESFGWPAPTAYTWSASGGTFNPGPQAMSPGIQFPAAGIYTITLASSNGTVSVYTKTITVTSPTLYFSSSSQTICPGVAANFTVSGLDSYTWQPGNVMSAEVSFTPAASQSYTCQGFDMYNCSTSGVVEVVVSPCTGITTYPVNTFNMAVYPNPAQQTLNLEMNNEQLTKATICITDAVGRTVHMENVEMTTGKQLFTVNVALLDKGIYFIKVRSPDALIYTQKFVKE